MRKDKNLTIKFNFKYLFALSCIIYYNIGMKNKKLTLFDVGLAFILAFVISQATSVVGVLLVKFIMSAMGKASAQVLDFFDTAFGYLLQAIFLDIGFVIVFLIFRKRINKEELVQKPNDKTGKFMLISIALGIATLFLLSGLLNYFELFVEKLGFSGGTLPYELNSPAKYIISLISLAVIPAVCEELLFRGIILNGLKSKSINFAVIMSSVMFSLFHFSPSQLIYPVCFGIILAIVYLHTNNIAFPMLLHFINNALTITIQYANYGATSTPFTHSISMLMYAIMTLAIWIVLIVYYAKSYIPKKDESLSLAEAENTDVFTNDKKRDYVWFWSLFAFIVVLYICLLFV